MKNNENIDPFEAPLLKGRTVYPRGLYNTEPTFKISQGTIEKGYEYLAEIIKKEIPNGLRVLVIDGFQGVEWDVFRIKLEKELLKQKIEPEWWNVQKCFATEAEINKKAEPFLGGDDRIFGTHYPLGPEIFFDAEKLANYRIQISLLRGAAVGKLSIFYGIGAGLLELWDQLWYIDIPKDLIQINARKDKVKNIGMEKVAPFEEYYKRSYFVEWPALNRQKRILLPYIDYLIDLQKPDEPTIISGVDFRKTLHEISESPHRVRPWFYPGPWGGKYMQGHMDVYPDAVNVAWSFEIIVPENGIILENDKNTLEFSFDFLMYQENKRILGKEAAKQFKYEWPIRLDYLDTINGGNLSIQCHPRPDFIRKEFGETYTQDESYYILNAKEDSRVNIGLTESCEPEEFKKALQHSEKTGAKVDIDKFVNSEPSKPHDLFLIPNGTVHGSGKDNLVLEISATPYIFTFKIYDWLRKDLEGKFRPLNIDRAWENIRFERRSEWVKKNLIAKPQLIAEGDGWKKYLLAEQKENWWVVHRVEFECEFSMTTNDTAYAANLVEGEKVNIITANGREYSLAFAESMIIPAAAEIFTVRNLGQRLCKLLLIFVRKGIGIDEALNEPND
jgi:mannose-6-phosphate isomerase class I